MENPVPIEGFPDYVVDRDGQIYTAHRLRPRKPSRTREGAVKVTLYENGVPHTRSLALIVAKAHLYNDHDPDIFDTPIHLDNDLSNNHVDNLAWRPRWFAKKYQQQYWNPEFRFNKVLVEDVQTGKVYEGLMEPCQTFGLLYVDVINSCTKGVTVFPTWKKFNFID